MSRGRVKIHGAPREAQKRVSLYSRRAKYDAAGIHCVHLRARARVCVSKDTKYVGVFLAT